MKKNYEAPSLEWLEVNVEKGFAATTQTEQMDSEETVW